MPWEGASYGFQVSQFRPSAGRVLESLGGNPMLLA